MELPRPNALLSALMEKFMLEAVVRRRREASRDERERLAEERAKFAMMRTFQIASDIPNQCLRVWMDGVSSCPMSPRGSAIPLGFYVARVEAHLPTQLYNPPFLSSSTAPGFNESAVLTLPFRLTVVSGAAVDLGVARVILHFQPRFQIPPVVVDISMLSSSTLGEVVGLSVEFDGRLIHSNG